MSFPAEKTPDSALRYLNIDHGSCAFPKQWLTRFYLAPQNGDSVFNGLAHFIKGGIFFWYGLLTFGRWMGCFADFGWAWNKKPSKEVVGRIPAMMPSAEFIESAVICFYGVSNVGLEHLANAGGEWAAIDLEHVSITLMFFGGGLVSLLSLFRILSVDFAKRKHVLHLRHFIERNAARLV